jgi:hypothetical protein
MAVVVTGRRSAVMVALDQLQARDVRFKRRLAKVVAGPAPAPTPAPTPAPPAPPEKKKPAAKKKAAAKKKGARK